MSQSGWGEREWGTPEPVPGMAIIPTWTERQVTWMWPDLIVHQLRSLPKWMLSASPSSKSSESPSATADNSINEMS